VSERKRRHDDAHFPFGGKGKRARPRYVATPGAVLVAITPEQPITEEEIRRALIDDPFPRHIEERCERK
jgi:hypothetical protein